jgi:presenilin-like A22 family membrane protease
MLFDIVLPSTVSIIIVAIVFLYAKLETKMKLLFQERQLYIRDIVFLVIAMGVMVTIIAFTPQQAVQILFLVACSLILFSLTYTAVEKWYFAVLPPIIFVGLYLSPFWGVELVDVFAIVLAVSISVYLGGLFSWITVLVFAGLITVMDVLQVFGTRYMVHAAINFIQLRLPILIYVPTFPVVGWAGLGLGDIFLSSLLAIQTMKKYGIRAGVASAVSIGFAFFLFETIAFYYEFAYFFPATLVVVFGWLIGLGLFLLTKRRT